MPPEPQGTSDLAGLLSARLADRYAIERELGRGGSAIVFLARDLRHARPVALKALHPELALAIGAERFLREVHVLGGLQHPNILPLLDSGTVDGHLFYVTPFVEGQSLRELLDSAGQLPMPRALQLGIEMADALAHAHERGVVHRDVKPENVLIEAGHAVLADFGIAIAPGQAGAARLTGTGISLGTPAYMSPEQAAGDSHLDARSDVYSAGCVLYEMLTGEAPFSGPTAQAIVARRLATEPAAPRLLRPAVTPPLERAVMTALARAPADRFQTARELRDALELARADAMAVTGSGHAASASASPPRSRRTRAGLIVAVSVAAVALGWIVMKSRPRSAALDANLVAVAPFEVFDPALALWREGFVDVLAANLDGAGTLRTVSPTATLRGWRGRSDRASASQVARSNGAGIAIFGRLERAGADSVRCTSWIDDAGSGERLGEVVVQERADRMDRLGDSLSIGIVRALGRSRASGSARVGSLGSRSLPAIKLFLQGEQLLRRSNLDSARRAYERAVVIDSTFGRAMNRLGVVLAWLGTAYNDEANRLILSAARFASGLAVRDSLQLVTDAMYARLLLEEDTAWWTSGQHLLRDLRDLRDRSPGDPVVWNALGEVYFHLGGSLGGSWEDALAAFDRSIALDSVFALAWVHPIAIALSQGRVEVASRYAAGLVRVQANRGLDTWPALVASLLSAHPPSLVDVDRRLAALPVTDVFEVWAATDPWPDSAEVSIRAARAMARGPGTGTSSFDDPALARWFLVLSLLARGHFDEARRAGPAESESALPFLAMLHAFAPDSAGALFGRWAREGNHTAQAALPWWASRGDTAAIHAFAERARSRLRGSSAETRHFAAYETRAADAFLSLARGDSAGALVTLAAVPDSLCPACFVHRLARAQLLVAARQHALADSLLRRDLSGLPSNTPPAEMLWLRARAAAAEGVGARERALVLYQRVAALYRSGDSPARRIAAEAERKAAQLSSAARP